jgi:hypothetical protein
MGLLNGIDNITGWAVLQKNSAAIEKTYAAGGSDNSDLAYFTKVAHTLTTPDALLKDYRALTFVATSFGLGEQVDQTAILRKLMTESPTDPKSLAMQLSDERYRKFAAAMSTASGAVPLSDPSTVASIVAGYKEQSFETSIGQDNGALQEATYFTRNALGATKLSQLMADKPLLDVVRTALGIPDAFSNLDYDQQVAILTPRVDMKQFATADGVAKFIGKYLVMDQLRQSQAASASDPMLSLFSGSGDGSPQGLSLDGSSSGASLNLIV